MLIAVLRDLQYFLFFFSIVVAFFSIFLAVLLRDDLSSYEGIGIVGYYIIALRESIGDYDTNDSYINNSDYKILIWIINVTVIILGNVKVNTYLIKHLSLI
jgi:hypothetical protein